MMTPMPTTPRTTPGRRPTLRMAALAAVVLFAGPTARAQNFVAVTDSTNPIVTTAPVGNYTGAAWVDVDGDGLLDLFWARKPPIFHNLGGGSFELISGVIKHQGSVLGTSWADYDNDGDIDCYVVGPQFVARGSMLYRNDGSFTFNEVTDGDIGDFLFNTGWGCSWGDVDNDGYTDLVIAVANGFLGLNHENRLLHNNGDGTLSQVFTTAVTESLDAHTIPTFSDYDQDGDVDLFIGSGEVSRLSPDNLFRNTLTENGTWDYVRITTAPIATDSLDGQVWNWIDYDNDGDLDAFQTNYTFAVTNNLYRNDSGTYVRMTGADVGSIVTEQGSSLSNVWGDFDNDGDLDCLVTNDGVGFNDLFRNDGGTFTQDLTSPIAQQAGPHYGAPIGDYDRDGDLDIYVHGQPGTNTLWENQLANGNSWIELKLVGAGAPGSNVSAIGAKVHALATIGGTPTWQMREVTAENGFNSMNMLDVHFGFRDASTIDSLVVDWPAGGVDVMTDVATDQILTIQEAMPVTDVREPLAGSAPFRLDQNVPNPFGHSTSIGFALPDDVHVKLDVYDVAGRHVRTLLDGVQPAGAHHASWDGRDGAGHRVAGGVYLVRLTAPGRAGRGDVVATRRMVLLPR